MKKFLLIILVICTIGYFYINRDKFFNDAITEKIKIDNSQEIIDYILSFNEESINEDFLNYIKDTYGKKVLKKLQSSLKDGTYDKTIWHSLTGNSYTVLNDQMLGIYEQMSNVKIIDDTESTMSFVGDISLADNYKIMPAYDERNKKVYGILSEDVVNIMNSTSFMVANNEFTISTRGEPLAGKTYTFRADPSRLAIYQEMGIDLVTLANNHIYDYGSDAFNDALQALKDNNIPYIGAGSNLSEAESPYYLVLNGYKIAFVNASRAEKNLMTPGATDTSEGVFRCYDNTELKRVITELKTNSDYVVLLIHWGSENNHDLEEVQTSTAKEYIDSGADIIVGSHAHTLQGMEFYNNKLIAYNLGDFIFNSYSEETGILKIKLNDDGSFEYTFIPCLQENEYTQIVSDDAKSNIIEEMNGWSVNANIDSEGVITQKS